MDRKKIAMGAALLLFASCAAWTVLSIPDLPAPVPESERKPKTMEYGQNTIREEVGGKLLWELTAASSEIDVQTQSTKLIDATGTYYFADGKVLTLTAPSGSYDGRTRNVKLAGGVTAAVSDGSRLTSRTLEWAANEDRLIAEGDAQVSQPGTVITADRLESWQQFREFRATGHARIVREKEKQ